MRSDGGTTPAAEAEAEAEDERVLLAPILETGPRFYIVMACLLAVMAVACFAWVKQLREGLGVTGLNRPVMWGFYITNFVFFIGVSHAGTLISAILRLCKAEWRRSITRSAEVITVMVLFFGAGNIILDLGHPERALFVFQHGHIRSPLLWDVISISTYLTGSIIYLFLPLIPDIALLRDKTSGWRHGFYRVLALGWSGTPRQHRLLERGIGVMAVLVIPIAVTVHTVVSWVFAMTIQPMWHSTIFGPYFVAGAIFSGIAALILAMALLRWAYHLEGYLKEVHFRNLGTLLLVMTLLWFYFTFAEHITTFYGGEPAHMAVFWEKVMGRYAPYFWTMVATCFVIPLAVLGNPRTRTIRGTVLASLSISVGMWLERFTIVVPTLVNPRMPFDRGTYAPSWVEIALMAGCFAAFAFLYILFTKFFPMISVWEVKEGRAKAIPEVEERIRTYLPDGPEGSRPARGPAAAGTTALVLLLVLCASPARAQEGKAPAAPEWLPADPLEGRKVFDDKGCARCHAIWGGEGEERVGPDLGRSGIGQDVMQLAGTLWNHTPQMIEKMREKRIERLTLSPEEMAKLAAYLFYLNFLDEPADMARGRELFETRSCARCHQIGGRGGTIGPRLDELKPFASSLFMAQAMWNHGPEMAAKMTEMKLERPRLEGDDVANILAFIRGEGKPAGAADRVYAQPGSPQSGKVLFTEKGCVKCHAIGGNGGLSGPDLGKRRPKRHLAEMVGALWNHGPSMWTKMKELSMPFPKLNDREIGDILAYLYFIQYVGESGNVETGRALFRDKSCFRCHPMEGVDPGIGPDLSASDAIRSPFHWGSAMWNHAPAMEQRLREKQLAWPRFQDDEMRDLVGYLRSRAEGK